VRPPALLHVSLIRLSVCVFHLREKLLALRSQQRHIVPGDQPHDAVVNVQVGVRELVAEVHEAATVGDAHEELRLGAREHGDSLADDRELTLDRGAQQTRRVLFIELDAGEHRLDGIAGLDDVPQVRGRFTPHRGVAWCARSRAPRSGCGRRRS